MKKKNLDHIKSTGFKVPDGYFDTFEEQLLNTIDFEADNKKTTGFTTPETYFDTLEDRIFDKLSKEKTPKVITLITRKTILYASSIAAAVLILFNLSIFNNDVSIEELKVTTVENYILDEDISSYEIASLFNNNELPTEDSMIDYNFSKENLEEYLLNSSDIESLMVE